MIIEILLYFLPIKSIELWFKERSFKKKWGFNGYQIILGSDPRVYLDKLHGVSKWSWKLEVEALDTLRKEAIVKYTDHGSFSGRLMTLWDDEKVDYKIID